MAHRFYTEEITALPFSVLRQLAIQDLPRPLASGVAGLLWVRGKLRWPLAATHGIAFQEAPIVVARDDVPPEAIAGWAVLEEPLYDLGFRPVRFCRVNTIGATRKTYALWLDAARSTIGNVEWTARTMYRRQGREVNVEFSSYAEADPEYTTSAVAPTAQPVSAAINLDFVDLVVLSDRLPVPEIYAAHTARITGKSVYSMSDEQAVAVHAERSSRRMRRLMEQGLLRELRPAEITRLRGGDGVP